MGGLQSKDAIAVAVQQQESGSKKMKKRDRSKSTPSLEEPTAVSNKKRHNSLAATLPRSWKSAKNESAVADKTKSLPTGVDSSTAMNGFSTLQRMKKEKQPKVQPLSGMTMTGPDGRQHRVYVTVRRTNATRPKFQKSASCSVVEEDMSSTSRPKMTKANSTATSNSSGKTSPPRQNSLPRSPTSPQGGTPSIKDLTCLKYVDSDTAESHVVHIIDQVACQWRKIGAVLNCEEYDLENISHNNKTVEDCCRVMFTQWCKGRIGDEPHTWARLIEAMQDARCGKISSEIKNILSEQGVWEYSDEKSCSIM